MKMEKKQCTKCKHFLLFECFKNKKTSRLTKCCIKCLEKSKQQAKCKHGRKRSYCKDCGGSQICEHNKIKSSCKDCGGGQICEHSKIKSQYKECDPLGYLAGVARGRVYTALKNDKEMSSTEFLRCNIETFKKHIEQQFTEGMSWENYSEWHIDQKIPLKYNNPSLEEVARWLHYTNTQPMWASENMSKGCRYISG